MASRTKFPTVPALDQPRQIAFLKHRIEIAHIRRHRAPSRIHCWREARSKG
jgi:hypothetical protein